MNNQTIVIAVAALCIGGLGGYFITQNSHLPMMGVNEQQNNAPVGTHRMPDGSLMNNESMHSNMDMMNDMDHSTMMVTSEREFIEGMIPHHQEAIDTALEVQERGGTTPAIQQLTQNIIAAQEQEIALMKQWYEDWYGVEYTSNETYTPMMRDLTSLSSSDIDRTFLEDMIPHHMGAIMMAQSVQPYIEHEEITALTQAIVTTQADEIRDMRQMLRDL